jgi:hypothetical protein
MKHSKLLQNEFLKKSFDIIRTNKQPQLLTDTHVQDLIQKQQDSKSMKTMIETPAKRLTKDPDVKFKHDKDLEFQQDHKPVGVKQLDLKEKQSISGPNVH